jgi:hypothetical protein
MSRSALLLSHAARDTTVAGAAVYIKKAGITMNINKRPHYKMWVLRAEGYRMKVNITPIIAYKTAVVNVSSD